MSTGNDTVKAWEDGEFGRDEKFVRRSTPETDAAIEEALELQMISIRLPKELIDQLKFLAKYHGAGYQPLIRDVLKRWARSELLIVANQMHEERKAKSEIAAAVHQCG